MDLSLRVEHDQDEAVLIVDGGVNYGNAARLHQALQELFASGVRCIRVDLSGCTSMDASGLATLIEGLQWRRRHRGRFELVRPSPAVRDMMRLYRLEGVFGLNETEQAA
ncbi:MAG: anti-sigma factor antagonist [Zetaproteobacteria bacterium]|nr:MAG: anti-sigma factor antagonist [Zetaproteobacteria bacterium]